MDFSAFWEFFQKVLWPLLLGYATYIHHKLDSLRREHDEFRREATRDYATQQSVSQLEQKLTAVLNRIDDKVTRILERDRHG